MTTWTFSDGTKAHLGGNVEGASLFAQELRSDLAQGDVLISLGAIPDEGAALDVDSIAHMDRWLRDEMVRPYRREAKLSLVEAPAGFEPLPLIDSDGSNADDDTLY